jgi:hypothetical protein
LIDEDSPTGAHLTWYANDTSGYKRHLQFFVESVPGPDVGWVLHSGVRVKSGQMLDFTEQYPYLKAGNLTFLPRENYCSTGRGTGHDVMIWYHAVAVEPGSDRIASVSDRQVQKVGVSCSRDKLRLAVPEGPLSLSAFSLRSAAGQYRHAENASVLTSASSEVDGYVLQVSGINITTLDVPGELINVTVSTTSGYLTFDKASWSYSTSPTHGRGSMGGGRISFWATPEDARTVLGSLTYQTYTPGPDEIIIQLDYGMNNNCTSTELATNGTDVTFVCQTLRQSIPVMAKPDPRAHPESRMLSGLHWQLLQLLVSMICYPVLFLAWARLEDSWTDEGTGADSGGRGHDDDADDEETVFDASEPLWIQHLCPETGEYYYENREDGMVTWMAPLHEPYVAWTEPATTLRDEDDSASGREML